MTTQQTFSGVKTHAFCGSGISSCFSLNRIALHQVHNSYEGESLPSFLQQSGRRSILIMRGRGPHDKSLSVVRSPQSIFLSPFLSAIPFSILLSPALIARVCPLAKLKPHTSISKAQPCPGLGSNPRLILTPIIFQWYQVCQCQKPRHQVHRSEPRGLVNKCENIEF